MSKFLFWLLTISVSIASHAQNTTVNNKSLLWKISGKGMSKASYLFGTMHMICKDDYVWTDKMKSGLSSCDEVCFEMNLDDPTLMMKVAAGMIDKDGKSLKDYFTEDQYRKIQQYIKDTLGMDITLFGQMKPIALETMFFTNTLNCPNPVSYEETIMKTAKQNHKIIAGLEDPSEQIELLNTIPGDSIVKDLLSQLEGNNGIDTTYKKLITAYKQQNLPELYKLILQSKELGDDMGAFLDERNKKWIDRMTDKMEQKSVFFAVGAGHLWGETGLIELLRATGYTVEPIR